MMGRFRSHFRCLLASLMATGFLAASVVADVPSVGIRCSVPYRIYQLPNDYDPWEQWDEPMMEQWMAFSTVLWYGTPSGAFGVGNGLSEMAGFLTDSQLYDYYGFHWGEYTLGLNVSWWQGGCMLESDIMFNADWDCWTTNIETVLDDSDCALYQLTAVHELGHSYGLDDYFKDRRDGIAAIGYDSVMNYAHPYYSFGLGLDDSMSIQNMYPARALNVHDVGIYNFYCTGDRNCPTARKSRGIVGRGESFEIEGLQVANLGNYSESGVSATFYLSSDPFITSSDFAIGTISWGSVGSRTRTIVDVELTVPGNAPTGNFYVGAIISGPGSDVLSENDTTFLPSRIKITDGGDDDDDDDDDDLGDDDSSGPDDDDDYDRDCEDICTKLVQCGRMSDYDECLDQCGQIPSSTARCIENARNCGEVGACLGDGSGRDVDDDDDACGC